MTVNRGIRHVLCIPNSLPQHSKPGQTQDMLAASAADAVCECVVPARPPAAIAWRSTDLLALPTCDPDKTFAVQISHEETMVQGPVAFVQCALLHTSSNGERRIRWVGPAALWPAGVVACSWSLQGQYCAHSCIPCSIPER